MSMVELSIVSKPNDTCVLEVRDFSYAYALRPDSVTDRGVGAGGAVTADWRLRNIHLRLKAGECHCIGGATGSGKSTLALALKGLLPAGCQHGQIRVADSDDADELRAGVGLVLQNPETQLFAHTVGAEVAFGLENMALEPAMMRERVTAALAAVDLNCALTASVAPLSMGQKYRLLLAAVLVMEPRVLILDEPVAQLDPAGRTELAAVLQRLKQQGVAIVLCEHRPQPLTALIDHYWQLDDSGQLLPGEAGALLRDTQPFFPLTVETTEQSEPLVEAEALAVGYEGSPALWQEGDFAIHCGQRVLLCGSNGCGKSSLMRTLCGFVPPQGGSLKLFGQSPSPRRLRGKIACLVQNPHKQLTEATVIDELILSHRLAQRPTAQRTEEVEHLLEHCGLTALADSSPHQLSYGQRHLVALATLLIAQPRLLLLDDPFAGLDHTCQRRVRAVIDDHCRRGMAVLCTCHDLDSRILAFDQRWRIEGGRFEAVAD